MLHRIAPWVSIVLAVGCSTDECDPTCGPSQVCVEQRCVATVADSGVESPDANFTDALARPDAADAALTGADVALGDAEPHDAGPVPMRLTITPTAARLRSQNGSTPHVDFGVVLELSDGSTRAVARPELTVDPQIAGTVDRDRARFTSNGRVGGQVRIRARAERLEAEAVITIEIEQSVLVGGTSSTAPALFSGQGLVDEYREADLAYPLDGAVMPQNVAPARIQWLNADAGDVFRVTLSKPNVAIFAYYSEAAPAGFDKSWLVDHAAWRRIAQSEPTQWAEIRVDRWIAATQEHIAGTPRRVKFAEAALLGNVYYWDIGAGRILRIDDATGRAEAFMPNPHQGCIGCHSVSRSGRYMAGRFGGGDNVGGTFDLAADLSADPVPTLYGITSTAAFWIFSSWSPREDRLVVSVREFSPVDERGLRLVDPFSGSFVDTPGGALPDGALSQPSWAPDDSAIAYIADSLAWGGDARSGDLYTVPVTGPDAFGSPRLVVTGTTPAGPPAGAAISYPSWSPDSAKLAFAHGTTSRSENGTSALYLVGRDGTGLVRLDRACGAGEDSFQPHFSPFAEGGYFWVSFLSRRDYGNEVVGTRWSGRQQIWVAAIRPNAPPGEDPSEVAYWLPGQETGSANISAYWAPRACRMTGEVCRVNAECCDGTCTAGTCAASSMCRGIGEACTNSAQCCLGALCVDSTCGGL